MPPCSCAFLSMRRRTESHPCATTGAPRPGAGPDRSGPPATSGLCSFIVAPTPKAGGRQVNFVMPTAGRGRFRKAPVVSRWTVFWFFPGFLRPAPSFPRLQKCPRRRLSAFPATTQEKHRPGTSNLAALRLRVSVLFRCICLQHCVSFFFPFFPLMSKLFPAQQSADSFGKPLICSP